MDEISVRRLHIRQKAKVWCYMPASIGVEAQVYKNLVDLFKRSLTGIVESWSSSEDFHISRPEKLFANV